MFPVKFSTLIFAVIILSPISCFYFSRRDVKTVLCATSEDKCTMEEKNRLRDATVDIVTRKHQDRVIAIRHFLDSQIQIFNDFFSSNLRSVHMDLDLMFTNTYGTFYQENINTLNDFFEKIKSFSVSFAETSMRTIVELFFDDLFQVMFKITNPFYAITPQQKDCMERYYRDIGAFDDIPQKIVNQLSLPLTNWKHFLGSLESLHNVLDGYLNITLKDECQRGLARMETCAHCQKIVEKPCFAYCANILAGCTHQMLDSEGAWKATTESMIKLANQLNHRQNLVSALRPIPILISEAVMYFQERRDFITNKMIGKCLLDMEEFGVRLKRKATEAKKSQSYSSSRNSRDHLILNQMFTSFISKMEEWKTFFGNVPQKLCEDEEWASKDNEICWNGTAVAPYELPMVNYSHPFKNPEYQGSDFLTFRGSYIEERLRLHWLQSRIAHFLSGKNSRESAQAHLPHRAEAMVKTDDEDYSDYDYEGSANPVFSSGLSKTEYTSYNHKKDEKIEIIIEPYHAKSALPAFPLKMFSVLVFFHSFLLHFLF